MSNNLAGQFFKQLVHCHLTQAFDGHALKKHNTMISKRHKNKMLRQTWCRKERAKGVEINTTRKTAYQEPRTIYNVYTVTSMLQRARLKGLTQVLRDKAPRHVWAAVMGVYDFEETAPDTSWHQQWDADFQVLVPKCKEKE